jgi:hypothetical protein
MTKEKTNMDVKNRYKTTCYNIEYIYNLYLQKRINLDLDVQRSYLWNDDKQQNLWDTLLTGFRIPEIHAIISGNRYDIIDGKQRLTTIFKILDDKVPFYKKNIDESLLYLFPKNKNKIVFSDLPEDIQIKIKNTELSIAEYTNLSSDSEDYAILFRKINSGQPLSEIAKGMSRNIHIRTHFTNLLIGHSAFKGFYMKDEDLELALVRYICLVKYINTKDLDTSVIPYEDFSVKELAHYCSRTDSLLNKIKNLSVFNNNRSKSTGLPHLLWDIDRFELSDSEIDDYIEWFAKHYSSSLTDNRNFNKNRIEFFKKTSEKWLKEMREQK